MSYRPSGNGVLEKLVNGKREKIRLLSAVTFTPGTAPTETETTLDEGERTTTGKPGPGEISFDYQPHPGYTSQESMENDHENGILGTYYHTRGSFASLRDNSVAADTLAIAATGLVTGAGAIDFGTEAKPKSPWTQGLGIIISNVLYIIQRIENGKLVVARYGAVADGFATPDDTALAVVNATQDWDLVQMGVERTYEGIPSLAGGEESSGSGSISSSATVVLQSPRTTRMKVSK